MIVTCPSCQTRFRFPPDRIGPAGARIRCSRCRGVFAVSPRGEARADRGEQPEEPPSPVHAAPIPDQQATPAFAAAVDPFLADFGPDPFGPAAAGTLAMEPGDLGAAPGAAGALQAALVDPGPTSYGVVANLALEDHTPRPPPLPTSSQRDELRFDDEEETRGQEVPLPAAELPPPSSPPEVSYPLPADFDPSAAPAQVAAAGTEAVLAEGASRRRRRALAFGAAAMNALSLVLLVGLAAAVAVSKGELGRRFGGGGAEAVTTARVTGGLFDTIDGSPVLVVRGEVEARRPVDGVRVRVALLDGGRIVATAEGLAGAAADPEQVFGAGTRARIAGLRGALDALAAGPLEAGARAPFVVLFPAPVPDLTGLEVRATAEPIRRP